MVPRQTRYAVASAGMLALIATSTDGRAQQSTTASFDNWIVQCSFDKATPPNKSCAASQTSMIQGKNIPFSRLMVGKAASSKQMKLVVQVPVNVSVKNPLVLRVDDAGNAISIPFDRCVPDGCFAEIDLKDDITKKLRGSEGNGKMSFKGSDGREMAIPVPLNGFRAAYDALPKEKPDE